MTTRRDMATSPRGGDHLVERQPHQLLQLGAAGVRLVERGGERGALACEQRLGVERVFAGGAAGGELLAADAQVLLRLNDGRLGGGEGREALLGGALRR